MIVAPGFIDPHTHAGDWLASADPQTRLIPAFLMQGVTTAFIGNDGGGAIDVAAVLASAEDQAGRDQLRDLCRLRHDPRGGDRRAPSATPTPAELDTEKALVARAMCQGAIGLLDRAVLRAAELFQDRRGGRAVGARRRKRGGYYDSHIRDEFELHRRPDRGDRRGDRDRPRDAAMPVHIAHIKALGVDVQGKAPAIIAQDRRGARARASNITASQYPWSAIGHEPGRHPDPALGAGRRDARRCSSGSTTQRSPPGCAPTSPRTCASAAGRDTLLITEGQYRGQDSQRRSPQAMGKDPIDPPRSPRSASAMPATCQFNMSEADIAAFMRQPWVMTDSDASRGHPRVWGTFARKYAKYVVADKVITLARVHRAQFGVTAEMVRADRARAS